MKNTGFFLQKPATLAQKLHEFRAKLTEKFSKLPYYFPIVMEFLPKLATVLPNLQSGRTIGLTSGQIIARMRIIVAKQAEHPAPSTPSTPRVSGVSRV